MYKCSDFYDPDSEWGIFWGDPDLGIDWPAQDPLLSDKDSRYPPLKGLPVERLPIF